MSISFEKLQTKTETLIGEGQSKQVFGKNWKELYLVISEQEENLTEDMYEEALGRCRFKDPERVGLLAFLCPPLVTFITDRVMGKMMKEFYKFTLYIWYFMFILTIIQSLIEWKMSSSIPLMILCMVVTSWCFRNLSRDYNKLELIYHVLQRTGKLDRVLEEKH